MRLFGGISAFGFFKPSFEVGQALVEIIFAHRSRLHVPGLHVPGLHCRGSDDLGFGMEGAGFDIPCESADAKRGDAVPVGIEFVPGETVTGRLRMGMVVVMPAFAEGEESDPHAIARGVRGGEAS